MLISYNWLKKYIKIGEPVEKVTERLVQGGVEVARLRHLGSGVTGVIVAELLSVEKHPQADRLSVTKVNTGRETLQVVCGAKNIAPGQRVPLALVGAVLPGDFRIKEAKIRGVESFGMLCSAKELGLAEDAEGILLLSPDAPLGQGLLEHLGLPDSLFELEITPNRADLLSHLGVAREVGALFHLPVQGPDLKKPKESSVPAARIVRASIEAGELCRQYHCRVLEDVQVGPSPLWLSQALQKIGQRPINNVVDVTNYVLHEMGQPLHAFDLDLLQGSQVIVREAKAGEKIPLLDGTERTLKEGMLVIADAQRPVALAGIMGGSNSQVTGGTRRILLESAEFLPGSVRKTARQLGISTDSSYRFERGLDPLGAAQALDRAASLILETAGGTCAKGSAGPKPAPWKPARPSFRPSRTNALLGTELPAGEQVRILKGLGFKVKGSPSSKSYAVEAPSYRLDLTREIDLIEEIARLHGYDRIPPAAPKIPSNLTQVGSGKAHESKVRFILHQAGFQEAVNSTFLPGDFADKLRLDQAHPLRKVQGLVNPIADDQKLLRPSLLPSLLANVQLNLAHQQSLVALYELNKVFTAADGPPLERVQAAAVLAGSFPSGWLSQGREADFFDIKGLAEDLAAHCGPADLVWEFGKAGAPYLGPQSFRALSKEGPVLTGGALHPKVLKGYDISTPCFCLEVELEALGRASGRPASFTQLPKFPSAWRDVALVVPDGVSSAQVVEAIESQGKPELKSVLLFDLYRGPHLSAGSRSLAYRLLFQDGERTLNDQEVTEKVERIVQHLKQRYSIALR